MAWISSPHAKTVDRRGDAGRAVANDAICLLVFSMVGLLTDCLALLMQDQASLVSLSFVLIAGSAPVAAMLALGMRER